MQPISKRAGPLTIDRTARFDAWTLLDRCEASGLSPMQTAYYFGRLAAIAMRMSQASMPPDVLAEMRAVRPADEIARRGPDPAAIG